MKIFNWECEINVCRMQPAGEMSSAKRYAAWRVLTDRELRNATGYVVWPEFANDFNVWVSLEYNLSSGDFRFDIPVIRNWLNVQPCMGFKYNYSKYSGAFSSGRTNSETFYGSYGWTEAKNWQVGIYGKYRFTFGPTHTPRARAAREKKEKAPKVRDGKVNVKVY